MKSFPQTIAGNKTVVISGYGLSQGSWLGITLKSKKRKQKIHWLIMLNMTFAVIVTKKYSGLYGWPLSKPIIDQVLASGSFLIHSLE